MIVAVQSNWVVLCAIKAAAAVERAWRGKGIPGAAVELVTVLLGHHRGDRLPPDRRAVSSGAAARPDVQRRGERAGGGVDALTCRVVLARLFQ